jgi:hypothetical protein
MSISDRVFLALKAEFGEKHMFRKAANLSGIKIGSWYNAEKKKQRPTSEMIEWVCKYFPDLAFWIATGGVPDVEMTHGTAYSKEIEVLTRESNLLQPKQMLSSGYSRLQP